MVLQKTIKLMTKKPFHVKDRKNLKINEDPEKTPSLANLSNTPAESQLLAPLT